MAAHQAGAEGQEVPLAPRSLQHIKSVDAQLAEDHRQLIHQGDIQVALGIFNYLGGLRHFQASRPVSASPNDLSIEVIHPNSRLRRTAAGHFVIVVSLCSVSPGLMRSGL